MEDATLYGLASTYISAADAVGVTIRVGKASGARAGWEITLGNPVGRGSILNQRLFRQTAFSTERPGYLVALDILQETRLSDAPHPEVSFVNPAFVTHDKKVFHPSDAMFTARRGDQRKSAQSFALDHEIELTEPRGGALPFRGS